MSTLRRAVTDNTPERFPLSSRILSVLAQEAALEAVGSGRYTSPPKRKNPFTRVDTMFRLATKFLPTSQAFETACAAGFRGAEFWLSSEILADWRRVLATARAYPLYYALHFPNQENLSDEAIGQAVLLHRELECPALVIHEPLFERHRQTIFTTDPSLCVAVENHQLSMDDFTRWAERNPGLTLDVEHLWKYTLNNSPLDDLLDTLETFLARFHDKLHHVHLPGYHIGGAEHCPLHHSPDMVPRVFSLLSDHGFANLVVSEANVEFQNLADGCNDVALFRNWWTSYASSPERMSAPYLDDPSSAPSLPDTNPSSPPWAVPAEFDLLNLDALEVADPSTLSS